MITLFWTHEYIDPIQVNIRVLLKKKQGKTARSPRAAANHRASGAGWWICWKWLKRLQFDISEQGDMNGKEREQLVTIHELIYWNYKLNAVWPQFIVDSLCLFFGCGQLQIISRYSCWGWLLYLLYIYIYTCAVIKDLEPVADQASRITSDGSCGIVGIIWGATTWERSAEQLSLSHLGKQVGHSEHIWPYNLRVEWNIANLSALLFLGE